MVKLTGLLRGWLPDGAQLGRALATVFIPAVLALGGFTLLSPPANWSEPVLLVTLLALATLSFAAQVHYDSSPWNGVRFDASYAIVLLALAVGGPLPAFLVWALPELLGRFFLRGVPVWSPGLVATLSSFGIGSLMGYVVLESLGGATAGATGAIPLFLAGVAVAFVNILIVGPLYSAGCEGSARGMALARQLFPPLVPAALGVLALGTLTWLALPTLGIWALVLMGLAVLLPELALDRIIASRPARELDPVAARRLYAQALGDVMALPARDRRVLALAAELPPPDDSSDPREVGEELARWVGGPLGSGMHPERELRQANLVALRGTERFDGSDWPRGLGILVPATLSSRILACAHVWSALTAKGGPELSQDEALLELRDLAGTALDPAVVRAASRVVERESLLLGTKDFQPKLHRIPLPRRVREVTLPSALARVSRSAA